MMRETRKNRRAKATQASKLAEIREALVTAGYDTAAKQAAVLGVCRSTAWVLFNRDKRVGPSANVIKRILSSAKLPPAARRKVEQYVEEKIAGLYGHSEPSRRAFSRSISYPGSTDGEPKRNRRPALDDRHRTNNQTLPDG
jgi:hypothetical protein